ncbi:MAG: NAD(P)/FAD-dependent oxidoreductase [Armatimonadota bacterium]|nr:NAD(P)/FAD-dependent oxidoreductase [Armatimonadota bacterium]
MKTLYEVVVIGGSFAGLSAAMQLARARRTILLLDTGKPRNRFAPAAHGFLGQDGRSPQEIMETGRAQLMVYPTVHFHKAEAANAAQEAEVFSVTLADGSKVRAKRLVLATGMTDVLPDVPGMQALWGTGVLHCPYCHGYEVAGRKFAVYGIGPISVHQAALVRDWSDDVTLLTSGGDWLTPEQRDMLAARGVKVEETPVARLIPHGSELEAVEFWDGRRVPYGALFTGTRASFASPLAEQLGCEIEQAAFGPVIKTDVLKETTVSGVFAAGDNAAPMYNATLASAAGVLAGISAHQSLLGLKMPMNAEKRAA